MSQRADDRNYQEILHLLKPTVLLEFGTNYGGSVLYFADVMKAVHNKGTPYSILTVDVNPAIIDPQASTSSSSSSFHRLIPDAGDAVGPSHSRQTAASALGMIGT
jgi:cephalosporin hydroxylase